MNRTHSQVIYIDDNNIDKNKIIIVDLVNMFIVFCITCASSVFVWTYSHPVVTHSPIFYTDLFKVYSFMYIIRGVLQF